MQKIAIAVKGQTIPVQSTAEEAARTAEVASYINEQLAELSADLPHASALQLMTLNALKMADQLLAFKNANLPPADDQQLLTAAVHHLTHRIDRIAEQLKAA